MSILSQRLREARSRMRPRVTQRDVAQRVDRSPSAVNLWEKGTSEPNASQLVILARWFGVTTDWLLGMDVKAPHMPREQFESAAQKLLESEGVK